MHFPLSGCCVERSFLYRSENYFMKTLPLFLAILFFGSFANAQDLSLNPLFSEHAVLQQEMPVPVWGDAKAGTKITVVFAGQEKTAVSSKDGEWMVVLDSLTASMNPQVLSVKSGSDTITISDILVGEVWVASGQSNMAMSISRALGADEVGEKAEANRYKRIRLFRVPVDGTDTRMKTAKTVWSLPTANAVSRFSAAAFFFGNKLAEDRSVPVGLIQSANGGTNAFSWINSDTLTNNSVAAITRSYWAAVIRNHPAAMDRYKTQLAAWQEKIKAAKAKGEKPKGRSPRQPMGPDNAKRPAGHYNAMIAPLQPYAMRGVLWYQGEANSRLPFYPGYKDLMLAMVEGWRTDWAEASGGKVEQSDFPFYLVQLPNFAGGDAEGWPRIREQMLHFWQEGKNTGMVVSIDVGEARDIHPRNKRPVGERLASFARGNVYGENMIYSGPIYDSIRVDGNKAIVTFKHVGGGLVSSDGGDLRHFQIAGEKGGFVDAKAVIEGDTVVLASGKISEPKAVRYAWSNNPEKINFGNKEGFPASPFRTDERAAESK